MVDFMKSVYVCLGVIVRYELFHNALKVFDTPNRREYTIDNLLPYSLHSFRVRACTRKGCGTSHVVEARTQEDVPKGFVNIVGLQVKDARSVQLQWSPPETPNGLLYYDVYFTGMFYIDPGMCLLFMEDTNDTFMLITECRSKRMHIFSDYFVRNAKFIKKKYHTML